jgi:hypothetical protein
MAHTWQRCRAETHPGLYIKHAYCMYLRNTILYKQLYSNLLVTRDDSPARLPRRSQDVQLLPRSSPPLILRLKRDGSFLRVIISNVPVVFHYPQRRVLGSWRFPCRALGRGPSGDHTPECWTRVVTCKAQTVPLGGGEKIIVGGGMVV